MIFAPGRVDRTASSTSPFTLVATKTISAPRPSVSSFSFAETSSLRGSSANAAPHCLDNSSRDGIVSVATMVHPRSFSSMVNIRPIGPWPCTSTTSSGCGIALFDGFQTGVDRFDKRRHLERNAVRDFLHAAFDDPVHHADILRKTAARGLESGRHAHFLINGTLRIQVSARNRSICRRECGGKR